ncbi:MAG TPA: hypothetical protein VLE94_16855, partial [Burkholderiaceae bacterium]|nr:hypothetical protein [Burkholderiaceae bacterium]
DVLLAEALEGGRSCCGHPAAESARTMRRCEPEPSLSRTKPRGLSSLQRTSGIIAYIFVLMELVLSTHRATMASGGTPA